jgi:hypothetical protein
MTLRTRAELVQARDGGRGGGVRAAGLDFLKVE